MSINQCILIRELLSMKPILENKNFFLKKLFIKIKEVGHVKVNNVQ